MSILTSASPVVHESCDPVIKAADDAWWSGFQLGLDGEILEPDPDDAMTPYQADCFRHGWEAGRREMEAERLAFCDAYNAYLDASRGDDWPEQELAEAFGHRGGPEIGGGE